jgi:hypothetical protein
LNSERWGGLVVEEEKAALNATEQSILREEQGKDGTDDGAVRGRGNSQSGLRESLNETDSLQSSRTVSPKYG